MKTAQRVKSILSGLMLLGLSFLLFCKPSEGFLFIAAILSFSFSVRGIRILTYYFTMARHMVGGKLLLCYGVIVLDFGMLLLTLTGSMSRLSIVLYLVFVHAFSGFVDIMRSLEARRFGSSWGLKMASGAANLVLALLCIVFLNRPEILVYFYCISLVSAAVIRIVTAFRKTAIVYIQ